MNRLHLYLLVAMALVLGSCVGESEPQNITYEISLGKVPMTARYTNGDETTWSVWGASVARGDDGLYHMYYSRWPKAEGYRWTIDSEIAHATSHSPFGPWEFSDVTLTRRGTEYWDGWCTHNPTIHRFGGRYYLYYMGNTGDGDTITAETTGEERERISWQHRNNQRIGVAVSDSPYGPWERFDKPLVDVSESMDAYDCLVTNNPAVCMRPDGKLLIIYKAVAAKFDLPVGGPVVHLAAVADTPIGPITKHDGLVFCYEGERFAAEDPTIWYQDGKYRAIVKRMKYDSVLKRMASPLRYFESEDGFDWSEGEYREVSNVEITWESGVNQQLSLLERAQIYIEDGEPLMLLCAASSLSNNNEFHSFNVQIPINIKKHVVEKEEENEIK